MTLKTTKTDSTDAEATYHVALFTGSDIKRIAVQAAAPDEARETAMRRLDGNEEAINHTVTEQ